MRFLADIPEKLIALLLVAALAWAVYNWTQRRPRPQK